MTATGTRSRSGSSSQAPHRTTTRAVLVLAVAALLANACGGPSIPSTRPSSGQASPGTVSSGGPSSGPEETPVVPQGDWATVELPPLAPVASLEPTKGGDAGVAIDTAFRLTSLDGEPVADQAKRLETEPAIDLQAADATGTSVLLHPASPLSPGQPYRLTLHRADGSVAHAWTMTTAKPLHIVGNVPDDQSTDVPANTGIEVTFDQSGVTAGGLESHVSIEPKVAGRVEVHGTLGAFIPTKPLAKSTLYTVTVKAGLPLPGTDQTLEHDVRIQFETVNAAASKTDWVSVSNRLADTGTRNRPTVLLHFFHSNEDDEHPIPSRLPITVHRLGTLTAATAAYERLVRAPDWAAAGGAPIDTSSMTQTLKATLPVHAVRSEERSGWLQLPTSLARGWYVLTITQGSIRQQVLIQVTDIASYAMVTQTRTVAWVNSLTTGKPVKGAKVDIAGESLGRTDSDGMRTGPTPPVMLAPSIDGNPRFLVVRDAAERPMFVPLGGPGACFKCESYPTDGPTGDPDAWWHVLAVERTSLRSTDHANVWGIVRARDNGSLPKAIVVRLVTSDTLREGPAVAEAKPTTSADGVFTADLPFRDLPVGDYLVTLAADGVDLGSSYVTIGPIVKPQYQLAVDTNQRAIISGAPIQATTTARFFDGTPVDGVDLRVHASDENGDDDENATPSGVATTTGPDGVATVTLRPKLSADYRYDDQWSWVSVGAAPILPEEAEIGGQSWLALFRSDSVVSARADITGSTMRVKGAVNAVDFARMELADPVDYDIDPAGAPKAGVSVRLRVTKITQTRKRTGTGYDFVTKRTSPIYTYGTKERVVRTVTVRTRADGTFRLSMHVGGGTSDYRVRATFTDRAGRQVVTDAYGNRVTDSPALDSIELVPLNAPDHGYGVGETIRVRARGGRPKPAVDAYLFLVASRGLQTAKVQPGPTFATRLKADWIPNATISAVRFNGYGYDVSTSGFDASLDTRSRALQVSVTPDATRYAPGGSAHLAVQTRDSTGAPVSASVIVRVIDEKLFAIGAAQELDLLPSLYAEVTDGILTVGWSHQVPVPGPEGGDTTGGGAERTDFRDWLLFKEVTTGPDGRAAVDVPLSDDLTSWRAIASAVDRKLDAGSGRAYLPVGLPFFADATLAPTYLVGETPVLRMRGFGSGLNATDTVTFEVSAPTLGLAPQTVTAKAFTAASLSLPTLPAGAHEIHIAASVGTGSSRLQDALVRTLDVVPTRAMSGRTATAPLTSGFRIQGGVSGLTTMVLADGGRGRVLPTLLQLASGGHTTGRADELLAASVSRSVLTDAFGMPEDDLGGDPIDLSPYQQGGDMQLFPYGSEDLELSVLAALSHDPNVFAGGFADSFDYAQVDPAQTPERKRIALVGRAAIGESVRGEIRDAAADPSLSATDRSWLAVGALAAGDEATATDLERAVLASNGQRLGPWVRVWTGDPETSSTSTALLAMAAAGIGDPLAADMDAYVDANPPKDTLVALQRAIAAQAWAARTPGQDAVASLTVDGVTKQVPVTSQEPAWVVLTPAQLGTASLAPVSGSVVVTTSWEAPLDVASLLPSGLNGFTRTVSPGGTIGLSDTVIVQYQVGFTADAQRDCWRIVDEVPSGLAPIGHPTPLEEGESLPPGIGPFDIVGQRVDFCADPDNSISTYRYVARVVSPGTYHWEPAVLQSSIVREWGQAIPATEVTIAGN